MKVRLKHPISPERFHLVSGSGREPPGVSDTGETDQCFSGLLGRQMVLVYFESADGASVWELEACVSELEPVESASP